MMPVVFVLAGIFVGGFVIEHGHPWFGLLVGGLFLMAALYAFESEEGR